MNKEEIKKIIPHREPMLLVDDAVASGEDTCIGHYTVTGDEFFLQGHFPGNPVVPGVILCEMMAQACCVLLAKREEAKHATPYFSTLNKVKFRSPVKPGDTLETSCQITGSKGPFIFAKAEGRVNGKLSVSCEFSFALVPTST